MTILEKRTMYANKIVEINKDVASKTDAYLMKLYAEAQAKAEVYRSQLAEQVKPDIEKCQRYVAVLDEMLAEEGASEVQPVVGQKAASVEVAAEPIIAEPIDVQAELHKATEEFNHAAGRPGMAGIEFPKR